MTKRKILLQNHKMVHGNSNCHHMHSHGLATGELFLHIRQRKNLQVRTNFHINLISHITADNSHT